MEHEEDTTNMLLEEIRNELISIIDEGIESKIEPNNEELEDMKSPKLDLNNASEICTPSTTGCRSNGTMSKEIASTRSAILDNSNISSITDDIHKMQYEFDSCCKLFQNIGERFENINFGCLKNRIKDLHLNERSSDSLKSIVDDLKHSFDEKYMENRLNELTKEVSTKFRNHPGEFGDIPEISEFFRTCTKLDQGLEKLRRQRDDCMFLQKRMARVAEASYERVNYIQQQIIQEGDCNIINENKICE
ncbi:hypothetical protein FF38_14141 [Lucilia cuprina]|uniref:Uncharacterized protein n=1 Tax=Lucilia cuprina TaxID=7375 RepID=A0A0L0C7L7_LUCCU|nr:hypothetical protein CVS40_8992 [Lucilia cuprina]KNC28251.1 hypothetical protein FF38_14141 [Lucilia cuprina]